MEIVQAILHRDVVVTKESVTPEIKQKVDDTLENWAKSVDEFTIMKPENERV